jgi:hypothetical protein
VSDTIDPTPSIGTVDPELVDQTETRGDVPRSALMSERDALDQADAIR